MANANEINNRSTGVTRFLPSEIKDIDGIKEVYQLDVELEKTKKNKNLFLYSSIFLFFCFVIGSVFYFTQMVEQKGKDFDINISDFEDLRLKDVIDSATRYENNLDLLKIQLDIIKINEKEEILKIQKAFYQKEIDILSRDLKDDVTDELIQKNKSEESKAIEVIKQNFSSAIAAKTDEINQIERELEKEKSNKSADQRSKFINNIDKLNAIKNENLKKEHDSGITALKNYYEAYVDYMILKYNPVFKSKKINTIMQTEKGIVDQYEYLGRYDDFLLFENVFTRYDFQNFRTKIDKFFEITKRLDRVPYFNSIKPAIKKINALTYSISHDYENLLKRMKEVVESKNLIIANKNKEIDRQELNNRSKSQAITALNSNLILITLEIEARESTIRAREHVIKQKENTLTVYHNALATLVQENSEGGLILSVKGTSLDVFVNPTYRIQKGMVASIFRKDDEYIGELVVDQVGDTVKASLTALIKNKKVKPFDKLIFKF